MHTRYDGLVEKLREAARPDRPEPPAAREYLEKVRQNAYAVTDSDVEALTAAGLSEDEIFEHTIAAAVGAGLVRLHAALEAAA
jgi:alkylhydroperoxidase family enzyme